MHDGHIEPALLWRYLDGDADAAAGQGIREHLDSCDLCRKAMTDIEDALRQYRNSTRATLKPPPRPWADLRARFHELDAEQLQVRRRPSTTRWLPTPAWWVAAAAGIAAAAFIGVRLTSNQTVSAAELLEKASRAPVQAKRLAVKTRKKKFIRQVGEAGDAETAALFREARFDWDDPLNPRSFADWRNSLPVRRDVVSVIDLPQRAYRITTSTPQGSLSEVSILIRAADLRAVQERFEFRNSDWIEITEAPSVDTPPAEPVSKPDQTATGASASDEVRVIAALHTIGADLGEPVEVKRVDDKIEVLVLGASSKREQQIRDALNAISNLTLRFEQPQAVRSSGSASVSSNTRPEGPLHAHLLNLMGSSANVEAFTNAALEASEAVLARAHALKLLADRFPSRAAISESDRARLRTIEEDHSRALQTALERLLSVMDPLTGRVEAGSRADTDIQALLRSAQRVDTLLNVVLASGETASDTSDALNNLRQALADLQGAVRDITI